MRLKRLVCRGFKSFADRTEFEFHSNLTGIIGPNGCGKSNVVDAIKWVLGDQRARSLRGQEMTDVIFKGAEGRDAMGMAEVVLTLEDDQGRFDGRTEIDIGRRLTVNKESDYLLNGSPVRLKDVRDVLMDTGLGVGAYSVMEQGRIDAVLSADPESRRVIFEEAAGISRFKLQKRESLRRLERTEQNLARVQDLLEERGRRIRSLKIQAGKARRWQELQGQLRELRSALAVLEGRRLRGELQKQQERMTTLAASIAEAEAERDSAAAALAAVEERIAAEAAALEELQGELHRCEADRAGAQSRLESQRHRITELETDASAYRQRKEALGTQTEERRKALADARAQLAAREDELIALHRTLEGRQAAAGGAQKVLRELQAEREELREKLLECIHERTRARNRAHDQEAQLRAVGARHQRLRERLAALGSELRQLEAEQQELAESQASLDRRERELGDQEQHALQDLQEADSAAADLTRQETDLSYQLSQVEGRKHALEDMEAHMEGLDQGARWVLETRPEGLRGRLLDLLEADLEFGPALEAALGPYAQALVVDTRRHAEAILGRLHADKRGRVLVLVREEFGPDLERVPDLPLPAGARFLAECVRTTEAAADPESRRMVHWLLRGVCLVDDLCAARGDRADLCFVTKAGTLLCGPRMEGGTVEGQAGLVVRRSHIQALGERADVLRERLEILQQGKDRASGRVEELKQQVRSIGSAVHEVRQRRQEAMGQRARLQGRAADLDRERSELGLEGAELGRARCAALAELARHLMNAFLVERREELLHDEEREQEAKLAQAQEALQETAAEEQEVRLRLVACREGCDGLQRNIRVHEEALGELDKAGQHLEDRLRSNAEGASRARAEVERLEGEVEEHGGALGVLQERRSAQQEKLEGLRGERVRCQDAVRARDEKRSEIEEERTATRLQISEIDHKFTRSEERLREETGVELRRCLGEVRGWGQQDPRLFPGPPAPPELECLQGPALDPEEIRRLQEMRRMWEDPQFDAGAARREVQVLQSKRDRLGAVNLDAVEELADEEEQFVFLEQETADLKDARRSLIETLRRLETESRALFEETFAAARENFLHIFRKLFQGGRADMFLTDPENALESGIEIVARPPGKELQSINLLSGGERSMTALAILFAVFRVKPSPFCILDEVDAALDDTNVERFLRVLRDFLGETQFCIVTHHKRTMAECQTLYGVTMQRRGVSSRIAVSLEEVDSFQEGAKRATSDADDYATKRRVAGEERVGF